MHRQEKFPEGRRQDSDCLGQKKHHDSFQDALAFALRISFVKPDSLTGSITRPHAAHVILFLQNEVKLRETFSELVVARKERGESIFRYRELNPDRGGSTLVVESSKSCVLNITPYRMTQCCLATLKAIWWFIG